MAQSRKHQQDDVNPRFQRDLNTPITGISDEATVYTGFMLRVLGWREDGVHVDAESDRKASPLRKAMFERYYGKELRQQQNERERRFELLFEHYGLRQGDWEALARTLAQAFVPGLRIARRAPGKKQTWAYISRCMLRAEVNVVKAERTGRSFTDAVRIVAKRAPWSRVAKGAKGVETLRRVAYEADPTLVAMMCDGDAWKKGSPPWWFDGHTAYDAGQRAVRLYLQSKTAQEDFGQD